MRELEEPPRQLEQLERVSGFYEASIPAERPYVENVEDIEPIVFDESFNPTNVGTTRIVTVDLDASGTGSYAYLDDVDFTDTRQIERREATRTVVDGVVAWDGTYRRTASGPGHSDRIEFSTRTRRVDARLRAQEGTFSRLATGFGDAEPSFDLAYALTGEIVDDASRCELVAGSITHDRVSPPPERAFTETRYTKAIDDPYWTVRVTTRDGTLMSEYLVPSLGVTLYCGHTDLE